MMRWVTHEHIIFLSPSNRKNVEKEREREKEREICVSFSYWFDEENLFDLRRTREKIFHWMEAMSNEDWFKTNLFFSHTCFLSDLITIV